MHRKRVSWARVLAVLLPAAATAAAQEWRDVTYRFPESDFTRGEEVMIAAPGVVHETGPPGGLPWRVCIGLGNHWANLRDEPIPVFSATCVSFGDYSAASGNAGKSSSTVTAVGLGANPVATAIWDISPHAINISAGATFSARYSTDGTAWVDAYVYPRETNSAIDPPPVTLRFDPPIDQRLYVGWFADVPEGETGWWNLGDTGTLTLVPPGQEIPLSTGTATPAGRDETWEQMLRTQRVVPGAFIGTTTHVNHEFMNRLLDDLGMRAVRIDFRYEGLEPARGQYSFGEDNWMMRSAGLGIEHGLDQLAVLTAPPGWIQTDKGTFPNDENVAAFEEFMFQLASKYKGKIRYWQAGNEPNIGLWKDRYVTFLKAFHAGVKRADPENKVVLCGFAGVAESHLNAVYRYGGAPYFDVIAAHSYTRPASPEAGGFLDKLLALHYVMTTHGDNKPLWITEMGWNGVEPSMLEYLRDRFPGHAAYSCTEEEQARYLARSLLIAATVPWVERFYFFHLHQEAAYTDVVDTVDSYMGLFTPWLEGQVRPKDAYFAVKTASSVMKDAACKGRIDCGPEVWAIPFVRENEAVVALWTPGNARSLVLEDTTPIAQVISMVGTPILVRDNVIEVSGRPIYLYTTPGGLQDACGLLIRAGSGARTADASEPAQGN